MRDDAATARADAKQEAARLVQQAADQAAATLAAAELQAAKIRAGILKLSADLGGVATHFTEDLLSSAKPAARPATKPVTRSAPALAAKPGVSPRRMKPETPAADKTKNRQVSAARKVTAAFVALTLAGAATGATELVLHGPAFDRLRRGRFRPARRAHLPGDRALHSPAGLPVLATANTPAQRRLGKHWKTIQRVTYALWALIVIHLLLLDDFTPFGASQGDGDPVFRQRFYQAVAISLPLVILRIPP